MKLKQIILSMSLMMPIFNLYAQNAADIPDDERVDIAALSDEELAGEDEFDFAEGIFIEELLVTGSRLEGGTESVPVTVITSEDIEARGVTNIDQLFRQVVANTPTVSNSNIGGINGNFASNRGNGFNNLGGGSSVDLRGLGAGSTLVLLNGRRLAGEGLASGDFADISGISVASIERVEILTAGASAIYGADAVAGVVNIILKKDYSGLTATARLETSSTGASLQRYSLTSGSSWGSGNLTATVSYADEDSVSSRRFGLTTRDFRSRGGRDRRVLTSPRGIFLLDPAVGDFSDPEDEFANNVFQLPVNSGPVDFLTDTSEFEQISRDSELISEQLPISLTPQSETISFNARLTQDINSKYVTNFFADVAYSDRETQTDVATPQVSLGSFNVAFSEFGSPFLREDIAFNASLIEALEQGIIPPNGFETEGENISIATGFSGTLSDNWFWELSGSYSQNDDLEIEASTLPTLLSGGVFDGDVLVTPPFNLIRGDFTTSPETIELLRNASSVNVLTGDSTTAGFLGVVSGEFFADRELGGVQASFGIDYREEKNESREVSIDVDGLIDVGARDLQSTRTVTAIFGELSFPLTERITIDAAARWEETENKGLTVSSGEALDDFIAGGRVETFDILPANTAFNQSSSGVSPRLGFSWQLTDTLKFRATAGQSFRAPNTDEVGGAAVVMLAENPRLDPLTDEVLDVAQVPIVFGGNPGLENEVADTFNVGLEYTFEAAAGVFELKLDYFQIDYEDRITDSDPLLDSLEDGRPLQEPALFRDDSGTPLFTFSGPINIAVETISGVDFALTHTVSGSSYSIISALSVTHQLEDERFLVAGGPIEEQLGFTQPETRANFSSTLEFGDFQITGFLQYNGSYLQRRFESGFGDTFQVEPFLIDSFTTADLQVAYQVSEAVKYFSGTQIRFGANNIFDTAPPFLDDFNGFDGSFYDLRRRVVYLEIAKTF